MISWRKGPLCSWCGGVGCVRKGRMAYAEGRELRGQVRVVSARKNTEAYEKPLAASERPSLLLCFFLVSLQERWRRRQNN
jgi:hypothetical protein